jgi:hypothetical protein
MRTLGLRVLMEVWIWEYRIRIREDEFFKGPISRAEMMKVEAHLSNK